MAAAVEAALDFKTPRQCELVTGDLIPLQFGEDLGVRAAAVAGDGPLKFVQPESGTEADGGIDGVTDLLV